MTLDTGDLPQEVTLTTIVLLPKEGGGVRGIGLVEALWKLIAAIVNLRLHSSVMIYDSLHGFRARWGNGTSIL